MPLTLWKACHWAMIPASAIVAFLLLGIEEIGVQIEEPFGILPLGKQARLHACLQGLRSNFVHWWHSKCRLLTPTSSQVT